MSDKINTNEIGQTIKIFDKDAFIARSLQIVTHGMILESALGEFDNNHFDSYEDYYERSLDCFTGFYLDEDEIAWAFVEDIFPEIEEFLKNCALRGIRCVILDSRASNKNVDINFTSNW